MAVDGARTERFGTATVSPSRTFTDAGNTSVLPGYEHSIGVPSTVDVKADQITGIVDTIDRGGPAAVSVVD